MIKKERAKRERIRRIRISKEYKGVKDSNAIDNIPYIGRRKQINKVQNREI